MMLRSTKSARREDRRVKMLKKIHKGGTLAGVHRRIAITRGLKGTARRIAQITQRRIKAR